MQKRKYVHISENFVFVLRIVILALTFAMFSGLYAQTWCLPYSRLYHGLTGLAERFLHVLETGILTNHNQYKSSGVYCFE